MSSEKSSDFLYKKAFKSILVSILGNLLLSITKCCAGIFGNSHALVADGIESLTDVISSILLFMGFKYARRSPDADHPYGYGNIEPLLTVITAGFLFFSAVLIILKSINNMNTPHQLPQIWTLFVLGLIILYKEFLYRFLQKKSKEVSSSSLKAEAYHQRSDAITSIAAFIGILLSIVLGEEYAMLDDWAALIASGFIIFNSYLIFMPAFREIMHEQSYESLVSEIRFQALKVKGILGTEKCFIRKSGLRYHLDLHAIVDSNISVREGHRLSHELKDYLHKNIVNLGYIIIHIEPDDDK